MPVGLQGFQPGNNVGRRFTKKPSFPFSCLYCTKESLIPEWEVKRAKRFCSQSCRSKFHAKFGAEHHNWKGGISNKWDKLHASQEYKDWRMAVFSRDHFTCQTCGCGNTRPNPIHAHHIKPKKDFPELVLDVSNGMTLCRACHIEWHRGRHG